MLEPIASLSSSLRRSSRNPALLAALALSAAIVAAAGCGNGGATTNGTGFGGNTGSSGSDNSSSNGMGGTLFEVTSSGTGSSTNSSSSTGTSMMPGAPCKGTPSAGAAQWAHSYGAANGQYALAVATDASGNVLVTGQFTGTLTFGNLPALSASTKSLFVAKLGPDGAPKWAKSFTAAATASNGVPYVTGRTIAADDLGNVYIGGDFLGTVTFGADALKSAGGFFGDAFVAKLDPNGNPMKGVRLGDPASIPNSGGGTQYVRAISIRKATTGTLVAVVGETQTQLDLGGGKVLTADKGSSAGFVAVLSGSDGSALFGVTLGDGSVEQTVRGVGWDKSGDLLITGRTSGAITFPGAGSAMPPGTQSAYVAKIKGDGSATAWSKLYGADKASGEALAVDASGNVYVTGDHTGLIDLGGPKLDNKFGANVYVAKLDNNGVHLYSHTFGDSLAQHAHGIALDSTGRALVAGQFAGTLDFGGGALMSGGSDDIFVARVDAQGCQVWAARFGDAALQTANAVTTDAMGDAILVGNIGGVVDFGTGALTAAGDDVFVAKFAP